jgi:hypothetical protein
MDDGMGGQEVWGYLKLRCTQGGQKKAVRQRVTRAGVGAVVGSNGAWLSAAINARRVARRAVSCWELSQSGWLLLDLAYPCGVGEDAVAAANGLHDGDRQGRALWQAGARERLARPQRKHANR